MNYLLEKKQILELKLKLTSIALDKQDCIRNQQYEKVADLRQVETELMELLNNKKNELIEIQNKLDSSQKSVEESNFLTILIEEIKLQELMVKPVDVNSQIKSTTTNEAFERITKIRNDLLKGND
jgi:hypothetical protein